MYSLIKRGGLVGGAAVGFTMIAIMLAGGASATTDPVADAFTTMQGKVVTYGGAIVALVIVSAGIFLGIKYLRKGVSKA